MNLEQLIYLNEVYTQGSITKAANQLYVSQSTVSTAISHLEKELNITLFKRSKNGVVPTTQGETTINYVRKMLAELDNLKVYALNCQDNLKCTISIASAPSFSQCIMAGVLGRLLLISPEIQIKLQEGLNPQVIDDLYNGTIDFGIIGYFDDEAEELQKSLLKKSLHLETLHEGNLYLYCHCAHPLLSYKTVSFDDIIQFPLITYHHLRKIAEDTLPFSQTIKELDNYEYIKKIICKGQFLALLPNIFEYNDPLIKGETIVRLNLPPLGTTVHYGWIRSLKNPMLVPEIKVIDLIKEEVRVCTQ